MNVPGPPEGSIAWDASMLARFKKAYETAPGDGHAVFEFEGHRFVKGYARYLIMYLDDVLRRG